MGIKALLGVESVDAILATFDKQRESLRVLAGKLRERAADETRRASELKAAADEKAAESERALRVAARIDELVG